MTHLLPVSPTFRLVRSLEFLASFPPAHGDFVLADDRLAGVFAAGDCAVAYRVREAASRGRRRALAVDTDDAAVVPMIGAMLGAADDLTSFYRAAEGDAAPFRAIVDRLRGLHHVRFRTLEEVTVHAVLGQRTPMALASTLRRRVAAALGPAALIDGRTLHGFPGFARLTPLEPADWLAIVGHRGKAARLPVVVRGVAALGASWLATAPYAEARAALEAIDGVGPFTSAMILLRGLGRMDDVPLDVPGIARVASAVYGAGWNPERVRARYGADLGYWSFYLKAGHGRTGRVARPLAS
jgi:DNA-3-methyladenine glycosylase II